MTPEELVKGEIIEFVNKGEIQQALLRLMQILDPDLFTVSTIINMVRQHGHGQVIVNVGKGKINSVNETLSYLVKPD